jgi:hypothetical protein
MSAAARPRLDHSAVPETLQPLDPGADFLPVGGRHPRPRWLSWRVSTIRAYGDTAKTMAGLGTDVSATTYIGSGGENRSLDATAPTREHL